MSKDCYDWWLYGMPLSIVEHLKICLGDVFFFFFICSSGVSHCEVQTKRPACTEHSVFVSKNVNINLWFLQTFLPEWSSNWACNTWMLWRIQCCIKCNCFLLLRTFCELFCGRNLGISREERLCCRSQLFFPWHSLQAQVQVSAMEIMTGQFMLLLVPSLIIVLFP